MAILTTTQDALNIHPCTAEEQDSECLNSLAVIRLMTIHLAILQILHLTLTATKHQTSTAHLFLEDQYLTTIFTRMSWGIHHILDAVIITHIHEHFLKLLTWLEEGFYCLGEEVHLFLLTYMMKRMLIQRLHGVATQPLIATS